MGRAAGACGARDFCVVCALCAACALCVCVDRLREAAAARAGGWLHRLEVAWSLDLETYTSGVWRESNMRFAEMRPIYCNNSLRYNSLYAI